MATYCSKRRKASLLTLWLYLELIAALLIGKTVGSLSSTPADVTGTKVCIGTNSRLSVPSNREHHYRNLRDRYNNCTYVDGNLELTWLQDESLDLSFLENIREVTGYVLISHMDVPRVILPRLQIIRGRTLFNLHNYEEHFALSVTYSQMFTLELPALRDILHGSVEFFNNFNLCHVKSIDWTEIISGPNGTYNYVYDFQTAERECPKCHASCEKGCWGDGPQNCQKFSKVNCSPQCDHGRCFGTQPRECCHLFCAGGCTGPTQRECIACKNFYDDGVCKQECPPMQKYNSIKYLWENNPAGKYAYGATCVKECPEHLLKDSGACVRSCPADKMAKDGECVPCNGPCPKTCAGAAVINSGNIDSFKGCTIIEGSIRILEQSFDGYQDFYNNTIGPRYIAMHPERLEVFSTVKEITGYLDVEGAHPAFENLSCFSNLEIIHGRQLMENYFASLSIVRTSLKSFGLKSLKRINSGAVVIQQNEHLCYADGIDWMQLQKSTDHGFVIAKNRLESECANDGFICSKQCDATGCWSSGNDQCLKCKNFAFNGTCLADCGEMKNTYQFDAKTCRQCHSECESCSGPTSEHCHECKHVKDQSHCVPQCPDDKYAYYGICLNCDESCDGCYGANNTIGPNGCKTCDLAIINNDDSVQCLRKNEKCPDGYYWEYVMPQEEGNLQPLAGKAVCRKCHPRCELCSGYGFHEQVCLKCAGFKRGEQCEDECPSDYYADKEKGECFECHPECKGCTGPGLNKCLACRNFKVFGDVSYFDNSTVFNCTSKCPAQLPHVIYRTSHIGAFCSSSRAKLVAGMENYLLVIIIAVPFVVLLCGIFLIFYICRQKLRAKKDAVKMTMVLSGCDDAEPLRPTNIGANLTKLRIIKESALRKGGMLGMGAFGRVFKGVWMPEGENLKIPVAIKELHKSSGVDTSEEFLREAYIMASVEHPHLLKLLAVSMASEMMLVTQLMPLGCLLDYVRNNRDKISSKSFLNWCTQIAKGMAYLEEKRLVHRDLAARNVLVQTPACVKITDFGLAKLLSSDSNEYKAAGGKMPIKWLALECIQHRVFTSKSDVWAYGVTVWELLTYGQRPYEHISAKDLVYEIEKGLKLEQPEICSLDVYLTLITCWHIDSEARPTFKQLVGIFSDFARDPGRYLAIAGDSFIRTPAFNTQTEGEELKNLAAVADGSLDVEKGATGFNKVVEVRNDMGKLNSYCKDPMNRQVVEKEVLCLNLPVDEDDYLLPSCKKSGTIFNNNLNNNNNHGDVNAENAVGYLDVLGAPNGVDNPEYLLEAKGAKGRSGVMMNYANVNDELNGKHEYYNDADVGVKKESCV